MGQHSSTWAQQVLGRNIGGPGLAVTDGSTVEHGAVISMVTLISIAVMMARMEGAMT